MGWSRTIYCGYLVGLAYLLAACGGIEIVREPTRVNVEAVSIAMEVPLPPATPTTAPTVGATAVPEPVATAGLVIGRDEGETAVPSFPISYNFNVTSIADTQCWRVRTDIDGTELGEAVFPAPSRGLEGSGALAFQFKLPPPIGQGAQIDQLEGGSTCGHRLPMLSTTGQVEAWVYYDTNEAEPVALLAEPFFAPIDMKNHRGGNTDWLQGLAIPLQPNQWTYICWDATNSPTSVGFGKDDWLEGQLQAFGIEIKYANAATRTSYEGIVYIDNIQLSDDANAVSCA